MGGRGSAGHRWRGTVSGVRSAGMRSFQGGQDIGCVLGGWGEGGSLPGGRTARRVIRRMTRVSHDGTPPPSSTPSLCQGHEPPAGNRHCGIFPFSYLYIFPCLLLLFLSSSFFSCLFLCVYQMSSFYTTVGLPPPTPGPQCGRSKEGGRSFSVVNFNSCAHCRYFNAPAPNSPPPPSCCVCMRLPR